MKYQTGRQTHQGVEVCQYFDEGTPQEKIAVIAHAVTHVDATRICNALASEGQGHGRAWT